jgi:hypothetical protein
MNIVWDKRVVEKLQTNYTVLELETFEKEDKQITAFCVLDSVPITELPNLENIKKLHQAFIDEFNKGNYKFCLDAMPYLKGKFNGALDSFYDTLLEKIQNN